MAGAETGTNWSKPPAARRDRIPRAWIGSGCIAIAFAFEVLTSVELIKGAANITVPKTETISLRVLLMGVLLQGT
jgi:hypothetical protein